MDKPIYEIFRNHIVGDNYSYLTIIDMLKIFSEHFNLVINDVTSKKLRGFLVGRKFDNVRVQTDKSLEYWKVNVQIDEYTYKGEYIFSSESFN